MAEDCIEQTLVFAFILAISILVGSLIWHQKVVLRAFERQTKQQATLQREIKTLGTELVILSEQTIAGFEAKGQTIETLRKALSGLRQDLDALTQEIDDWLGPEASTDDPETRIEVPEEHYQEHYEGNWVPMNGDT